MRTDSNLLKHLVIFNNRKICVEIGVRGGGTTKELCAAAKQTGGQVFGFDCWTTHGLKKQFQTKQTKAQVAKMLKGHGYNNFTLTQVDTMTPEFPVLLAKMCPKIDFAFIDGCHSYLGIKNDFDAVYPLLANDGIIAFHDTVRIDGCREFILDLRTKYSDGTFDVVDFPWGWGKRRNGLSLLVKRFVAASDIKLDEVCGSLSLPKDIYRKGKEWLKNEKRDPQKVKISLADMKLGKVGKI